MNKCIGLLLNLCLLLPAVSQGGDQMLNDVLADTSRAESDRARDARSQPAAVLGLAGLKPGDVVADIFGGGGYYSDIIARIVGDSGKVYLHNNQAYLGFVGKALKARMETNTFKQIVLHEAEATDLALPEAGLDLAMIVMSYHDLYHVDKKNGWFAIDGKQFLGQIHKALKPGGRFLIVDHQAKEGRGNKDAQNLHRIEESFAIKDIESNGFALKGKSDALRNAEDDHTIMVFDPAIRGKTDRFVLVFEKR